MINYFSTNYNLNVNPESIKLFDLLGKEIIEIKDK